MLFKKVTKSSMENSIKSQGIVRYMKNLPDKADVSLVVVELLDSGKKTKLYLVKSFRNYKYWQHLQEGDVLLGLVWKSEKDGILNADYPPRIISEDHDYQCKG